MSLVKGKMVWLAGLLCMGLALQASANEVEVSLSDAMVDFRFTSDFEQDFMGRLALMYSEDDEASGGADIENALLSYTFGSHGRRGALDISLGGRVFYMDVDIDGSSNDGSAVGLGFGFGLGTEFLPKFTGSIDVYYSPDILTGGDLDSTLDTELRLGYQVIDNGSVFLGWRVLRTEIDDRDGDVYNGGLIGMRLSF